MLCCLVFTSMIHAAERIIDTRDGASVTREQLVQVLAGSDFILLGELHDNSRHHQYRGELLTAMQPLAPVVVAEHLEIGKTFVASGVYSGNLQGDLEQAGFDAKGWRWPLHQPLFAAVVAAGMPLLGGNIQRAVAKKTVREGVAALPDNLSRVIAQAPLNPVAQEKLDADLLRSHCGQIDAAMLPGLRLAQRARDAAMYSALSAAPKRPVVLVAGNGHVRLDYGVPDLIRQHLPDSRFISVGFAEDTSDLKNNLADLRGQYHYLWVTEQAQRDDPCVAFPSPGSKTTGEMK